MWATAAPLAAVVATVSTFAADSVGRRFCIRGRLTFYVLVSSIHSFVPPVRWAYLLCGDHSPPSICHRRRVLSRLRSLQDTLSNRFRPFRFAAVLYFPIIAACFCSPIMCRMLCL